MMIEGQWEFSTFHDNFCEAFKATLLLIYFFRKNNAKSIVKLSWPDTSIFPALYDKLLSCSLPQHL